MSETTRWSWRLLDAGPLLLDGGSMFGVVPRAVWTRSIEPDERNRIALRHNCLLLEAPNPEGGNRLVVIETGTGDKLDAKMRGIFGLDGTTVHSALHGAGCDAADVSAVVVTHLHFDHAGGLTRRPRPNEGPEWTGEPSGDAEGACRTFPNATVYVQHREWEDAIANRSVMTRTYYRDHLEPIRDHLHTLHSPIPFPTGHVPDRDEMPLTPLYNRETRILHGLAVFLVPGHTWGQQAIKFTDIEGRTVVFVPDVMPSVHHVGAAYSLAYDVEPYTSMASKRWLLTEAADQDWLLVLDHEPTHPCVRVRRNDRGWFDLVPEEGLRGTAG